MRSILLAALLLLFAGASHARSGQVAEHIELLRSTGARFEPVSLFDRLPATDALDKRWNGALKQATVLGMRSGAGTTFMARSAEYISLELPTATGSMTLDLERASITTDDFKLSAASGMAVNYAPGLHYRGMVRGIPGSVVAISVFGDEVMGLIIDAEGELVLGRFEDRKDALHVLYREADLLRRPDPVCSTLDAGEAYRPSDLVPSGDRTIRCVRYYWEVNYNVFQDKGTVAATTSYITGLFNQSAILFANDGVNVVLSELFVWDVPSPYTGPSSGNFLTQFGVTRTSFNGDLAHLVGYGGGGGVAWLNVLCSSSTSLRMAFSGIFSSFSNVPAYSWSTMVVTHEAGHNLGSGHTHACVWNGNGTAIDGCGPVAGYTEGTCPQAPVPTSAVGGTIMSYCHLVSAGINLANGFGPQPAALIVNRVNAASCLGICGTTCDPPSGLFVSNLNITSATLNWAQVGATSYTVRWKPTSSSTWTTVPGLVTNTYALAGLTQGTGYEFQVLSVCGASSSAYSASSLFTTPVPCPESLEPNNSLAAPAVVVLPANINALIATAGDLDYYSFTTTGAGTISISLTNLPGDYDLRLLSSTGTTLASSEVGGNTSESINFANAAPGTYLAYVFGYNGAFSGIQCYNLFIRSIVSDCIAPQSATISAITFNSATATWPLVQTANGYDLRWKASSASTWTDVLGLSSPFYAFSGLVPTTSYDVQVRSICSGSEAGTTSEYTSTTSFNTLAAPCEVAPPIVLPIKLVLGGAYRSVAGLMVDSLRKQGVLPLQEPYTALGYTLSGSAITTEAVIAVTGANAITDWVVVELRDAADPTSILETRAGLVQRDGDVVGMDGTSALGFCASAGLYQVAVHHRNHLGVMTASAISLSASTPLLDFTLASTVTYGTGARRSADGLLTLYAGNVNGDPAVKYSGSTNDRDVILTVIGGVIPTNTVSGYRLEDCNLDGSVKYAGSGSDRDVILSSIGGVIPTNTVIEQLP